jgi:two-component system response regulator YesN
MINILIVDDEPLVRASLQSFLNWEDYGFTFIGEASNGREALTFIGDHSETDIVLLDIQMPVLNGIQMLEEMSSFEKMPKVLVLSANDQYQNVRKAFQLGATDYILKSEMDEKTLLEYLQKTAASIEALSSMTGQSLQKNEINVSERRFIIDSLLEDILFNRNIDLNRALLKDLGFRFSFPCFLAQFDIEDQSTDNRVRQIIRLRGEDLFKQSSSGSIHFLSNRKGLLFLPEKDSCELSNDLISIIRDSMNIELNLTCSSVCKTIEDVIDQYKYIQSLDTGLSRIIHRAQQYIRENYKSPFLSLDEVSSHVQVSRTHLSAQFKKEAGMTFRDYLTRTRVDSARKLLEETNLRVYEICELVGYTNVEHFSRIFKKTSGHSPNRYHKKS